MDFLSIANEHQILMIKALKHHHVTRGTWVTAWPNPACLATNGNKRSSACRMVPSIGTGSSGYPSQSRLSASNGASAAVRAQNIVPTGKLKNGGNGSLIF